MTFHVQRDPWMAFCWWRDFADAWRLIALALMQWSELYAPFRL